MSSNIKLIQIANDVYVVSKYLPFGKISVNSFLILDEEPTIIDTGVMGMGKEIIEAIQQVVAPPKIKHILITHEHPDHAGGLPEIVAKAYNAKVYAHKYITAQLAFMGIYGIVEQLEGGETIEIGARKIEVVYAPIETHGYVYYILWPDKIVFSGDYFGQLSPEGWRTYWDGSAEGLIKAIAGFHEGLGYTREEIKKYLSRLQKLSPSIIAPSHGSIINKNLDVVIPKVINYKLKGSQKGSLWSRIFGGKR